MGNIYFYYGEESLIIKNKIERLIRETKADEYNITTYDLDEVSIVSVLQDAITMPFLTDKKVVVCKNPRFLSSETSLNDKEMAAFNSYLQSPMETTYFIIDANNIKLDERKEIVKRLKKLPNAVETKELSDIEIDGWIKRQCAISGVDIKDDAVRTFYNMVGKNLINAKNEIDKLISYVGPSGVITTQVINKVVAKEIQNDVFSLSNAIVEQNKSKIISLYKELIESGNDVYYLFSLVSKSMREIYLVNTILQEGFKQADVSRMLKVSPGRAYYMVRNARNLDIDKVREYIIKLGDLDYQMKSGKVDIKAGFELFLFAL
ncbi:MAG: DNA polymerase III subunit delta [Bacilli bacterium]|nr:DNA polymerase III subunit delta [Bacilli bacterium]